MQIHVLTLHKGTELGIGITLENTATLR